MTDPETRPQYLRRVEIRDHQPAKPDCALDSIHISNSVLFDGVPCPTGLIDLTAGWEANGSWYDGTVLSFTVDASKVQLGQFTEPGKFDPFVINGVPVVVPSDQEWELIDGPAPKYLVYIFVREFAFTAAPSEGAS